MPVYNEAVLQRFGLDLASGEEISSEITLFTIPGGVAAGKTWAKLAENWRELGGWPILCGPEKERSHLVAALRDSSMSTKEILAAVPSESPLSIFEQRYRDLTAEFTTDEKFQLSQNRLLAEPDYSLSLAVPEPKLRRLHGTFERRGRPFEKCLLALMQPAHRAHGPAYLRFGDLMSVLLRPSM